MYSPIHCKAQADQDQGPIECKYEEVNLGSHAMAELGYLMLFVYTIGPIRVFLKIKEGKTSIGKIIEDFEDERGQLWKENKKSVGILPTTTRPQRRRNPTEDTN